MRYAVACPSVSPSLFFSRFVQLKERREEPAYAVSGSIRSRKTKREREAKEGKECSLGHTLSASASES